MDYIKILEEEINRLNTAMKCFDSINVLDYNTIVMKKKMQRNIHKGYGLITDVKMDLEKIVRLMGEG